MEKTIFVLCLVVGSSFPSCIRGEYGSAVTSGGCKEGYGSKSKGDSSDHYSASTSGITLKGKSPNYGGGSSGVSTTTSPGFDIRLNRGSDRHGYGSSGSVGNAGNKGYYGGTPAGSSPSHYGEPSKPPHQGYHNDPHKGVVSGSNAHDYSSKGTYNMAGYGYGKMDYASNVGVNLHPGYGIETSFVPPTNEFTPGNLPANPHDYSRKGARGMAGYGYDTKDYSPHAGVGLLPGFGIERGFVPPTNEFIPGNIPSSFPVFPDGSSPNNYLGNSRPGGYIPLAGINVFTDGNNGVIFPAPGTGTTILPGGDINTAGSYPGNNVKGYPSSNSKGGYSAGGGVSGYDGNSGRGRLPLDNGISSYSDINIVEGIPVDNNINVGVVPVNTDINSYSEISNNEPFLTSINSYSGNSVRDRLPTPNSIGGYPDSSIVAGNSPVGIFPVVTPTGISDPNFAGGYGNPVSNINVEQNEVIVPDLITVYLPPRIPEVNTGYLVPIGK